MMKKILTFMSIVFLATSVMTPIANAEGHHKHRSHKMHGMHEAFNQFLFDQFDEEINKAVSNYYKNNSMKVQYHTKGQHPHALVKIVQSKEENKLSHPYILTFIINTYEGDQTEPTGIDKISFGVTPLDNNKVFSQQAVAGSKVELIEFKHHDPKEKIETNKNAE